MRGQTEKLLQTEMLLLSVFTEPGRPTVGGEDNSFGSGAGDDLSHFKFGLRIADFGLKKRTLRHERLVFHIPHSAFCISQLAYGFTISDTSFDFFSLASVKRLKIDFVTS